VRVEGGSVFHPANPFILDGVDEGGASPGALWGITNGSMKEGSLLDMEPFSFHPGRMNVLMADGSVRGLNLSIPLNELIKGIGIADGTSGEF
jgi:prepilin-type processing-associated H-X9-DG protein